MSLSRGTLLQVNATVIAGLLVLVAIQPFHNITPRDMALEGMISQKEFEAFDELSESIRQKFKEENAVLDNRTADFLIEKTWDNTLKMAEYVKRAEIYENLSFGEKIIYSANYPANILIIPFAISCIIEIIPLRNRGDNATSLGMVSSYVGFGMMISVFLGYLFY